MKICKLLFFFWILMCSTSMWTQEQFLIEGAATIGSSHSESPAPGTIRFNDTTSDFEGWNGSSWLSLTGSSNQVSTTSEILGLPICVETQILEPPHPSVASFGFDITRVGDQLFLSNPFGDDFDLAGAVYVYLLYKDMWYYTNTIQAPDPEDGDRFGSVLAANDTFLFVGGNKEQVHIYSLDDISAVFSQTINSPSTNQGTSGDGFGKSLDVESDLLVIGAPLYSQGNLQFVGKAYAYIYNGSSWERALYDIDPFPGDGLEGAESYGKAIDIYDGRIAMAGEGEVQIFKVEFNDPSLESIVTTSFASFNDENNITVDNEKLGYFNVQGEGFVKDVAKDSIVLITPKNSNFLFQNDQIFQYPKIYSKNSNSWMSTKYLTSTHHLESDFDFILEGGRGSYVDDEYFIHALSGVGGNEEDFVVAYKF